MVPKQQSHSSLPLLSEFVSALGKSTGGPSLTLNLVETKCTTLFHLI